MLGDAKNLWKSITILSLWGLYFYFISPQYQVFFIPPFPRQIPVFEWHWSPGQHFSPAPQPEAPSLKHMPPRSSGHPKSEHLLTSPSILSLLTISSTSPRLSPPEARWFLQFGAHFSTALSGLSSLALLSTSPSPSPPDFTDAPKIYYCVYYFYFWWCLF